jgi:hypothetical protein
MGLVWLTAYTFALHSVGRFLRRGPIQTAIERVPGQCSSPSGFASRSTAPEPDTGEPRCRCLERVGEELRQPALGLHDEDRVRLERVVRQDHHGLG